MSKPNGIALTFGDDGTPMMRTTTASIAEDAIWSAAEESIRSGVTPEAFMKIAAQAWRYQLKENMEQQQREADLAFTKPVVWR